MRIGSFKFSIAEFSGSLGDFGTLLPLAIGYIVINGLDPSGFLIVFGLINIVTGIVYRIPMPLQPMKAVAALAIAQAWSPQLIAATAFSMGLFWLLLGIVKHTRKLIEVVPDEVIRGIQATLGVSLVWQGVKLIVEDSWVLGAAAVISVVLLNIIGPSGRQRPVALYIMGAGLAIMVATGFADWPTTFSAGLPNLHVPSWSLAIEGFWKAGIAQIPLTFTNAIMAVALLIKDYFPHRVVTEERLMINTGLMNLATSVFGGFPLCHGAGGLAGQYYYGARTGGANLMEGGMELALGLFFASSVASFFQAFPMALVGAMMVFVGIELGKLTAKVENSHLPTVLVTVIPGLIWNMGIGFLAGVAFSLWRRSW